MTGISRRGERSPVPAEWTYAAAPESRDVVKLREQYGFYVGGAWSDPAESYATIAPSSEETLARVGQGGEALAARHDDGAQLAGTDEGIHRGQGAHEKMGASGDRVLDGLAGGFIAHFEDFDAGLLEGLLDRFGDALDGLRGAHVEGHERTPDRTRGRVPATSTEHLQHRRKARAGHVVDHEVDRLAAEHRTGN